MGHVEVVSVLLERGADIDKAADDGATPLIMASQEGHGEVVSVLLEQGADIDKARMGDPFEASPGPCGCGESAAGSSSTRLGVHPFVASGMAMSGEYAAGAGS
jgi:hypothetical protein